MIKTSTLTATLDAVREDGLCLRWCDGRRSEFAGIWLRDNRPEDRDGHSGQRLIDVTELPPDPRIRAATIGGSALLVSWHDEPLVSVFPLEQLRGLATAHEERPERQQRRWLHGAACDPRRDFAWQSAVALRAAEALRLEWLVRLLQDGIAFMSGVPQIESGILEAAGLVGRVAETNYGLVFDVRAVPTPENLAYSDLGLGLHTDNPYREPVPGFQALHVLVAAPDGGDSLFADGVALALHLRERAPAAFDLLTRTPVPFHYRADQADLYAERPLIELDCTGAVAAVHYNSRSIAPLNLPAARCAEFYGAYRLFAEMLQDPRFQVSTQLGDGDLVVFDNRRILHGRTGFASNRHARHLRGCYLTRDSVYSETAVLRRHVGEGRNS